jgi:hypothetical protein
MVIYDHFHHRRIELWHKQGKYMGRLANVGSAIFSKTPPPAHICSIPDDHIDPRRWALFVARSILTEMRDGGRTC